MIPRTAVVIALLAAGTARAEEARWNLRRGDVLTYEAETVVEWNIASKTGSPAAMRPQTQRHVETVTLRLEVLSVGEDGNARIQGTFPAVRVHVTAPAGIAEWDSARARTTPLIGFKRYEALSGTTFTATVAPDGRVLETKNAGTPDRAATPATAKESEEIPALAIHHPTPPRVWLDLVFRTVPPARKNTHRTLRFIEDEDVVLSFSRNEKSGRHACSRLEFETPDRKAATDPRDVGAADFSDPNGLAWAALVTAPKRGEAWFARPGGFLVRLEAAANASLNWDGKTLGARMNWRIELKEGPR
ncbi:MAG: hypothetical protein HYY18_06370 [Planctomycetes bacterium]|nr:hypothetical protein [Planctomycetota bacterium]